MRGLLVQPRATVQVDRWNGRETEPAHGVKRQGPNGFPPTLILTHFQDTGTHNHKCPCCTTLWPQRAQQLNPVVMGPGFRRDDGCMCVCATRPHVAASCIRSLLVQHPRCRPGLDPGPITTNVRFARRGDPGVSHQLDPVVDGFRRDDAGCDARVTPRHRATGSPSRHRGRSAEPPSSPSSVASSSSISPDGSVAAGP